MTSVQVHLYIIIHLFCQLLGTLNIHLFCQLFGTLNIHLMFYQWDNTILLYSDILLWDNTIQLYSDILLLIRSPWSSKKPSDLCLSPMKVLKQNRPQTRKENVLPKVSVLSISDTVHEVLFSQFWQNL